MLPSRRVPWAGLLASGVLAFGLSMAFGHGDLSDLSLRPVFLELRAYRFVVSFLAGGALAAAGVLVQGLFRNPLASPSLLGTSAGATLGGMVVLLGFHVLRRAALPSWVPSELLLPIGCLVGAWFALAILLMVAGSHPDRTQLLLIGFMLSAMFLSLGALVSSLGQERWELGRAMLAFTLGGVEGKGLRHVALALPLVMGGMTFGAAWARHLDMLLSGEEEAQSLGLDVRTVRIWIVVWSAVLTAAAVILGGNISFVGLVIPHVLRRFFGYLHRELLLAAFVGGGGFVALADVVVRMIPARGQVPLGVITSLVGAPVFLWLLMRERGGGRV